MYPKFVWICVAAACFVLWGKFQYKNMQPGVLYFAREKAFCLRNLFFRRELLKTD